MTEEVIYRPFIQILRSRSYVGKNEFPMNKCANFTHLRVNPQIISDILKEGLLREFSAFLILKKEFMTSAIYKATDSRLAQILGVSRQTAMRYKKVFRREGWITEHANGTIVFNKVTKVCKKYIGDDGYCADANVYVKVKGIKLKELIIKLKFLIIKQKELNTHYVLELRRVLKNAKNTEELKSARAELKKLGYSSETPSGEIDYRLQISFKGLSKLLNCSVGSAYNLIIKMSRRSLLKIYRNRKIIATRVHRTLWEEVMSKQEEFSKCICIGGNVIRIYSNKYNLIS